LDQTGRHFGTTLNEAVPAAQRALAYAPYRSEVWLLLADMAENYQLPNPKSGAALAMSYYTAPYNWTLAPRRLAVAARGDALTDPELQPFVERDLRMTCRQARAARRYRCGLYDSLRVRQTFF